MNSWKRLKVNLRDNEPLSRHTSLRLGGPARYFAEPRNYAELKLLLSEAKRDNIPILIIGSGSNILVSDSGVNAFVIRLARGDFSKIAYSGKSVHSGCGVRINRLLNFFVKSGLTGLEFLSGIPGTVGGALAMNAGAWSRAIGDKLLDVTVMDYSGKVKTLSGNKIKFGYRSSPLSKFIILEGTFKVSPARRSLVRAEIKGYLEKRKITQDLSRPSAGCIFKNPQGLSAGKLIDACGLKGKICGGARISDKHANFILNADKAKARDILRLIKLIQDKVRAEYGIKLEPEVKIWR
jgi:UDP-N-acetylmuramate dehydrogenase